MSTMDRDDKTKRRLKARNLALLLALAAFAVIVYIVSIVRMGGQ